LTLAFLFVGTTFHSRDMQCQVWKSQKSGQNVFVFCAPNVGKEAPNFWGAFVNCHHFRPTGQVWLRYHGWSFIYADEKKLQQ